MRRRTLLSVAAALAAAAPLASLPRAARAWRPPAAIEADRRSVDAEIDLLRRKTDGLSRSLEERRRQLGRRVRGLYRLSQGGAVRVLLGAETVADLQARRSGLGRLVARDLDELRALDEERRQLERERERLRERERRAFDLAASSHAAGNPRDFPARPAGLVRPVAGAVFESFGPRRDPATQLEHARDGVELRALPGEAVRAVAAGEVRAVEPLAGLGLAVIVDHGGGWVTVVARLGEPSVRPGDRVAAGAPIARAAGPSVHLQVMHAGTWLDPVPWLLPPTR